MYVNDQKTDWCERLPLITFAINSSVHRTTNYTPFFLVYGRELLLSIKSKFTETEFVELNGLLTSLTKARDLAREKIEIAQITNAAYHDESRRTQDFTITSFTGDLVVCRKLARKPGISPKLTKTSISDHIV